MITLEIYQENFFELDDFSKIKFRLKFLNWNDFGYYTLFRLEMFLPKKDIPFKLTDLCIININGISLGSKPGYSAGNMWCFINDPDGIHRILLWLSPQQRNKLFQILNPKLHPGLLENKPVFYNSINRDRSMDSFIKNQDLLKSVMECKIDFTQFLKNNRQQFNLYLNTI